MSSGQGRLECAQREGSDSSACPPRGADGRAAVRGRGGRRGGIEDGDAEGVVGDGSTREHGGEKFDIKEEDRGEEGRAGEEEAQEEGGQRYRVFVDVSGHVEA